MSEQKSSVITPKVSNVKEVKWPSTHSGGVMPVSLASRFSHERHRLSEDYTEKWRQYRIKYLQSLHVGRKNMNEVPGMYKEFYNPIRRFYRVPLNTYQKLITPYIGENMARQSRRAIAIFVGLYSLTVFGYYSFAYSDRVNNWETYGTLQIATERPEVLPGDPAYPLPNPKPYDWQFNDRGFSKRKSHLNI